MLLAYASQSNKPNFSRCDLPIAGRIRCSEFRVAGLPILRGFRIHWVGAFFAHAVRPTVASCRGDRRVVGVFCVATLLYLAERVSG